MLRDLAAEGQIAAALVYSPDRLSRKYAYQVLLSEELSRCGVELIFLKAPAGATPEDQLLVQFQGMIAEYERAQIAERCRRGKKHMAQQGGVNVLSGAPYPNTRTALMSGPILGAMAYNQRANGEKVHGIASAHGAVAAITGIAYGAAMLSVTKRAIQRPTDHPPGEGVQHYGQKHELHFQPNVGDVRHPRRRSGAMCILRPAPISKPFWRPNCGRCASSVLGLGQGAST
jgi:hypothetical protein